MCAVCRPETARRTGLYRGAWTAYTVSATVMGRLLSGIRACCYVDNHAPMWEICLEEALRASGLRQKGSPVKQTGEMVEQAFGR